MKVYFNDNFLFEFDNPGNVVTAEQIRDKIAAKDPRIADATSEVIDGNLYFTKTANKLG